MNEEIVDNFSEFYDLEYSADVGQLAQNFDDNTKSLVIDYNNLYRFDHDLAHDLRNHPEEVIESAEYALRNYDFPVDVDFSDAHVRFTGLGENIAISKLRSKHVNTLVAVTGVVRKVTEVRPKVVEAVFICQRCGTQTIIPQDDYGIEEPRQCEGCERDGPYKIDYDKSELVDMQHLKVQESPEGLRGGETPESITVPIEDDVTGEVTAGDQVEVTGVYRIDPRSASGDTDTSALDTYLEGVHVDRKDERFEDMEITKEDKAKIKELSNDPEIYNKLVQSIAPSIFGYEQEKMAIALQLFEGVTKPLPDGSKIRGDFHILFMGDPGTAKSAMIQYVTNIAPRAVSSSGKGSSAAGLTASAVRDDFADGSQWTLEAGALVLADRGVAAIDELDKMEEEDKSAMHEALEQQQVSVNKAGINATLKSRCSLLAAANPKYGRFDPYESTADQIDLEPALMSRFDLIFIITDRPEEEEDRELAQHILRSNYAGELYANQHDYGGTTSDDDYEEVTEEVAPVIEPELLKKYIAYAKQNCAPTMTEEARQKIEDFYVDLRLTGADEEDTPVPVTARKLEGLVRLAEASARVRLSETVEEQDAGRAVSLVRSSLEDTILDPDTGELDADIIETGTSKSQRDRIKNIKELISEMAEDYDDGVPIEDLKSEAERVGLDAGKVDEEIEKLRRNGGLYEPQPNHVLPT